jgi:hypothetical protein
MSLCQFGSIHIDLAAFLLSDEPGGMSDPGIAVAAP